MVKKLQGENAKQPIRQSRRNRILNTRLGTPPRILLDMLKDHSSSVAKKSLPAIARMERIETVSQKAVGILSKQNAKSPNITAQLLDTESCRHHNPGKRYEKMLEVERSSKSVTNGTVEETTVFASNKSRKPEITRNSKNEKMLILSKTLGNKVSKVRHSSRLLISNSRFDHLPPSEQPGNKKRRKNMKKSDDKKNDVLMLEEKVVAHSSKIVCGKSDVTVKLRHSERQRIPSKRLSFPDVYPVIRARKKSTKDRSKIEEVHKCKNYNKKTVSILKTRSSVKATSKNLPVSSVANSRQIHSSLEVPSVLYPYKPARSEALCVEPSSSMTKDYVSKKDVEELIDEINKALARITDEDYSALREKIAHHLNSLHRENCRFRQTLLQLRSELDSLSSNLTVNRYNMLIKQNGELRELKVLADIKCEAQMEEVRQLLERIKILEARNKSLEDFRNRLVKQKMRQHLNGGTKYSHTDLINNLSKMNVQDVMNAELESLILNEIDDGTVRDNKSNGNNVAWGNDSWMLHC